MAKQSVLDILIVDDELDIPLALSTMLNELAELKISIAVDGQEAMIALAGTKFDLVQSLRLKFGKKLPPA